MESNKREKEKRGKEKIDKKQNKGAKHIQKLKKKYNTLPIPKHGRFYRGGGRGDFNPKIIFFLIFFNNCHFIPEEFAPHDGDNRPILTGIGNQY